MKHKGASVIWYSFSPIVTYHGRITAREYMDRLGNQVYPMIQMLFLKNDAVSQADKPPILAAGTVHLWFEGYEGELQHLLWAAESSDFNMNEPL
jgi:hypothetical protein